jgi:hypothetical protein
MNETQREKFDTILRAAENIVDGFSWDDTEDGHDYWKNVHYKLVDMAKKIKLDAETVNQHDLNFGDKFVFVGTSQRRGIDGLEEPVMVRVNNPYGEKADYYMETETFEVYAFADKPETLRVVSRG